MLKLQMMFLLRHSRDVVGVLGVTFSLVQCVEYGGVPQGDIDILVIPKFLYKVYIKPEGLRGGGFLIVSVERSDWPGDLL
jgi:hypothetical protein